MFNELHNLKRALSAYSKKAFSEQPKPVDEKGSFATPLGSFAHGRYFALWSRASGQWKLASDTCVTLGCRGAVC